MTLGAVEVAVVRGAATLAAVAVVRGAAIEMVRYELMQVELGIFTNLGTGRVEGSGESSSGAEGEDDLKSGLETHVDICIGRRLKSRR